MTKNEETIKLGEEPHSAKININQNGKMSAEIKCYGRTPSEALERTIKLVGEVKKFIGEQE